MKTKTYPIFHIDGRRARTLRKELGLPRELKDLDEDTTTEKTQIELALVAETLNHGISTMRRMVKYSQRGFYACVRTMREVAQSVVDSPADQPISVD